MQKDQLKPVEYKVGSSLENLSDTMATDNQVLQLDDDSEQRQAGDRRAAAKLQHYGEPAAQREADNVFGSGGGRHTGVEYADNAAGSGVATRKTGTSHSEGQGPHHERADVAELAGRAYGATKDTLAGAVQQGKAVVQDSMRGAEQEGEELGRAMRGTHSTGPSSASTGKEGEEPVEPAPLGPLFDDKETKGADMSGAIARGYGALKTAAGEAVQETVTAVNAATGTLSEAAGAAASALGMSGGSAEAKGSAAQQKGGASSGGRIVDAAKGAAKWADEQISQAVGGASDAMGEAAEEAVGTPGGSQLGPVVQEGEPEDLAEQPIGGGGQRPVGNAAAAARQAKHTQAVPTAEPVAERVGGYMGDS